MPVAAYDRMQSTISALVHASPAHIGVHMKRTAFPEGALAGFANQKAFEMYGWGSEPDSQHGWGLQLQISFDLEGREHLQACQSEQQGCHQASAWSAI